MAIDVAGRTAELIPRECIHCRTITEIPLAHYLLECDTLADIRPQECIDVQIIYPEQSELVAVNCARILSDAEENLQSLSATPPPR